MKPTDVKWSTDIDFEAKKNDKDPKFKVFDQVRMSKYENIFAKGYTSSCSEEMQILFHGHI